MTCDVLTLAVEVAIAMQLDGHAADARRLILETRPLLDERYDDQHEVTLLCDNAYGADLRTGASSARHSNSTAACCPNSRPSSARITNAR